jgi:transcriptional regulator with XRE-family HTH domain
MKTFKDELADGMRRHGVGRHELSKITDTTYEWIRKIEAGKGLPSDEVLLAICAYLKLDASYMMELVRKERSQ